MKQIIKDVLDDMSTTQVNLGSDAARDTISNLISAALKTKGTYTEYGDDEIEEQKARESWTCSICGESTYEVEYDYIGSGTNHLGCELKSQKEIDEYIEDIDEQAYAQGRGSSYDDIPEGLKRAKELAQEALKEGLQKQAYMEMTSDGLPEGGDAQAVLESHKLADEIVDNQEGKWIYESPDGGETVFRRPFSDYDPENKEEIDWETKEPTGRKFTEYPFKVNRGLDRRRKEKVVTFSLGTDDE